MAYSVRFKTLEARVIVLRKQFLPARFSPSGAYSPAEFDNARAYRMLVHAELEHYLEPIYEVVESDESVVIP